MSVKEFFEFQQLIKKDNLYKFKGEKKRANSASYKIRPKSQNKITIQSNNKNKINNNKKDLSKDNTNIKTLKNNNSKKKFKTIEKNKTEEMSGNTEDQNVAEIFRDISKDNTTSEKFPFSNRSDVSDDIRSKNENNENKNKKNNNNNKIEDNKKKLSQLKIMNSEGKEENWNIEED